MRKTAPKPVQDAISHAGQSRLQADGRPYAIAASVKALGGTFDANGLRAGWGTGAMGDAKPRRPRPKSATTIRYFAAPLSLADFTGQEAAQNLRVFIAARKRAATRSTTCCSFGPPGLNKTTLAQILAREMGVNFRFDVGAGHRQGGRSCGQLTNLRRTRRLFIDEIIASIRRWRNPLSSHGGFPARSHHRRGARRRVR